MIRTLPSLIFCFALFALIVGCKKQGPEPALEGHWNMQNQAISTYWQNGDLRYNSGPLLMTGRFRAEISRDSIIYLRTNFQPEYRANAFAYIRQGSILRSLSAGTEIEIKELSAHSIILYFKGPTTANGRQDEEDSFSR
jgi:hypothetical protein